ncbi:TonB-dependent siderophore receptor [Caenimonas koreensis]|uniref:TonB-dependent receptor n=1 Tax=Caenimonas koreensis DSM 17982 TaxID=1121255 RepID=A0A844AYM9_9BURK|nr:TonB-dependent receptor [Caenimonas koreensis]MRD49660.1 TonB-dependent receptor [Caenimonas koreensis DSM 17982]
MKQTMKYTRCVAVLGALASGYVGAQSLPAVEIKANKTFNTSNYTDITGDELRNFNPTNIYDLIKNIPSITVEKTVSGRTILKLLGQSQNSLGVMLNGQSLASADDLESISVEDVERVQVDTTSSAAQSGSVGFINIVTKRRPAAGGEMKMSVDLRGNEIGSSISLKSPGYSTDVGQITVSASVRWPRTAGVEYQTGVGPGYNRQSQIQYFSRVGEVFLNPALEARFDDAVLNLSLPVTLRRSRRRGDEFLEPAGTLDNIWGIDVLTRTVAPSIVYSAPLTRDVSTTAKLRFSNTTRESARNVASFGVLTDSLTRQQDYTNRSVSAAYQLDGESSRFGAWSLGTELVIAQRQDHFDLTAGSRSLGAQSSDFGTHQHRLAVFGEVSRTIATANFKLGLRVLDYSVKVSAGPATGGTIAQPSVGVDWQVSPNMAFNLTAGRRVRLPTGDELTGAERSARNTPFDPDYLGNPSLRPELANSVEVSLSGNGEPLKWSLAAQYRRSHDVIVKALESRGGSYVESPVNLGSGTFVHLEGKLSTKVWGVNTELSQSYGKAKVFNGGLTRDADAVPFAATKISIDAAVRSMKYGATFSYRRALEQSLYSGLLQSSGSSYEAAVFAQAELRRDVRLRFSATGLHQRSVKTAVVYPADKSRYSSVVPEPTTVAIALELAL